MLRGTAKFLMIDRTDMMDSVAVEMTGEHKLEDGCPVVLLVPQLELTACVGRNQYMLDFVFWSVLQSIL